MLTVLLGLSGALVYGFADFLGGLASRRLRAVTVTAVAAAVGIVPLLLGLVVVGGAFTGTAVLWGAVAGASGGVAVLLLYRALAIGPMSVLSPLTAVFAAVVPVLVAVFRGTALSGLAVAALVVAVVAVVLVAAVRDTSGARVTVGSPRDGRDRRVRLRRDRARLRHDTVGLRGRTARRGAGAAGGAARHGGGRLGTGGTFWRHGRPRNGRRSRGVCRASRAVRTPAGPPAGHGGRLRRPRRVGERLRPGGAALQRGPGNAARDERAQRALPDRTVVLAGVVLRERLTAVQWTGIVLALAASVGLALA